MIRTAAVLIVIVLAATVPAFAQLATVGPTWTSDQVRAARRSAPEQALAFDVRQETTSSGTALKVESSHVVLAPDFIYIVSGKAHTLDDFQLKRTFSWTEGASAFANLNGHALPAFRVMELANRRVLQSVLTQVAGRAAEAPYWPEAELGVTDPASPAPLTPYRTPSGLELRLGKAPVVRVEGRAMELTDSDRQPFTRYLALHLPLHPQARHALVEGGVLPIRLEMELREVGTMRTVVISFSGAARVRQEYPLPPGLTPDVAGTLEVRGTSSEAGVRAALEAVDGHFATPKPTLEELADALSHASVAGRPLDVWLRFLEISQQYGGRVRPGTGLIERIGPAVRAAMTDPQVARFAQANALSGAPASAPGQREQAGRYLASAKFLDTLPFGTFRYVTFANLVRGTPDVSKWDRSILQGMPTPIVANYWTHIAAYPWAANAYKDAGDAYIMGFDTPKAWTAFDLGRAMDPDWRSGVMSSVADYEARLEAAEPDFF